MAKVTDQDIPSAVRVRYHRALQPAKLIRGVWNTIKRVHFRLPPMHGGKIKGLGYTQYKQRVSSAQRINRRVFCDAVRCFRAQPEEGGVEPPEIGPRNRSWWYDAAEGSGLWYFDYFMQCTMDAINLGQKPDWCSTCGQLFYWTEESNPDGVNWDTRYVRATMSWVGNSQIVYFEKPANMKTLYLYIYGLIYSGVGPEPAELIFSAHQTPLPEEGPTWNNYSRYGTVFKHYPQTAQSPFPAHWIILDCPDCKVIQLEAYTDIYIEGYELYAMFVTGPHEDYPLCTPYWVA